jgi:hypothetical protein
LLLTEFNVEVVRQTYGWQSWRLLLQLQQLLLLPFCILQPARVTQTQNGDQDFGHVKMLLLDPCSRT